MPERVPYDQYPLDTLSYWNVKSGDQRDHPMDPNIVEQYNSETDQFESTDAKWEQDVQMLRDEYDRTHELDTVITNDRTRWEREIDQDPVRQYRKEDDMFFDATIPRSK